VNRIFRRRPIPPELLGFCLAYEPARTVLKQLARPLDWVSLYRIVEVIQTDVGGRSPLLQTGWIARSDLTLFTRSANSPAAVGDGARHGRQVGPAPDRPMTCAEARSFVLSLVERWISKRSGTQV
jgi:hypothetical protein